MKSDNIRFVTRGLGPDATREFGEISSEQPDAAIDDVADLAKGIAGMATSLKSAASPARGRFWHFQRIASGWLLALAVLPGAAVVILVPNRAT